MAEMTSEQEYRVDFRMRAEWQKGSRPASREFCDKVAASMKAEGVPAIVRKADDPFLPWKEECYRLPAQSVDAESDKAKRTHSPWPKAKEREMLEKALAAAPAPQSSNEAVGSDNWKAQWHKLKANYDRVLSRCVAAEAKVNRDNSSLQSACNTAEYNREQWDAAETKSEELEAQLTAAREASAKLRNRADRLLMALETISPYAAKVALASTDVVLSEQGGHPMSDNPHDANAPASPTAQPELPPLFTTGEEFALAANKWADGLEKVAVHRMGACLFGRERQLLAALADAATQRDRADKAERELADTKQGQHTQIARLAEQITSAEAAKWKLQLEVDRLKALIE